ncbi:DUF2410 superfamily domain-containing protein [Histoplasma ohiense]|nr:DUF2410 superfamily domain-containing protein [Histoplasma ohiense (nom. inval.)]
MSTILTTPYSRAPFLTPSYGMARRLAFFLPTNVLPMEVGGMTQTSLQRRDRGWKLRNVKRGKDGGMSK